MEKNQRSVDKTAETQVVVGIVYEKNEIII